MTGSPARASADRIVFDKLPDSRLERRKSVDHLRLLLPRVGCKAAFLYFL